MPRRRSGIPSPPPPPLPTPTAPAGAARSLAAWAVLGAAVLGGCASSFDRDPRTAASGGDRLDDHDPASLIPAGLETVIDVDLAALRRSAWTAPLLQARDARTRAAKTEALGYDDVADVDRIIYAVTSAGADAPTLVVAQGRLPSARIADAFRARWPAAVVDRWRGILVLTSGENAIALLSERTFTSGSPASVRAVVDRAFGIGADLGADPALGPTRRALDPVGRNTPPAVLATVAIDARIRARVGDAVPLPRELRQIGVRLDVGEALDLHALGVLDDREAAAAMARRLAGALRDPMIRLGLAALGLETLLSQVHVTSEGARVLLQASAGPEQRAEVTAALRLLMDALRGGASPGGFGSW